MLRSTASMNRRWRRIGLVVLCVVGADFVTPELPGAFWFESEHLFVVGIASDRESAGQVGRLTLEPGGRGARPLRLPFERLAASPTAALDDH